MALIPAKDPNEIAGFALAMHNTTRLLGIQLLQIFDDSKYAPGLAISNAMLAALTGEFILKAWIGRTKGEYPAIHDLTCLTKEVDYKVWEFFDKEEKEKILATFENHREDFTDWRYLFENYDKVNNKAPSEEMLWATGILIEKYSKVSLRKTYR